MCRKRKDVKFFYVKNRERKTYTSYCRPCWSKRHRKYYRSNHKYFMEKNKRQKERLRAVLRKLKDRPCADCGGRFPYCAMDFDHRERTKKLGVIAQMAWTGQMAKVIRETEKCDVVCANCHRIRTHRRRYGDRSLNG